MIIQAVFWIFKLVGKVMATVVGLWLYKELTMGICKYSKKLDDKIAVVTGATSGLGLEVTKQLVKRGCHVIMGCRNMSKASKTIQMIKKDQPDASLEAIELHLDHLKSVRKFAHEVKQVTDQVNILVNNAGVFYIEENELSEKSLKKHTKDGLELTVGTNFFGHVYLTQELMKLIKNGGTEMDPARIINVSSFGHIQGPINVIDLDLNANLGSFNSSYQYCLSKMALIHWSNKLARSLEAENVISVCVNPGEYIFKREDEWWVNIK